MYVRPFLTYSTPTTRNLLLTFFRAIFQGKKKHININKFAGLSRDWVGAEKLFMCFFGSFPMGEKKHINKIPPQIPGQSRENFVYVFFSLCVFFAP